MNSPKFRLLYKAPQKDYFPHLLTLESCMSSKFFHFLEKKNAARIMGVVVEVKKTEAKDPLILQPDKKEYSPPSTKNCS